MLSGSLLTCQLKQQAESCEKKMVNKKQQLNHYEATAS